MSKTQLVPTHKEIDYQACWNHLKKFMIGLEIAAKFNPFNLQKADDNRGLSATMKQIESMYIKVKR